MGIRLVLADNHPLMLNALENLFRKEADFQVMATCSNAVDALAAVRRHRPDILITDIRMPGKDGLAIIGELLADKIPTRVIFFTAEINEEQLLEVYRTGGVAGIVLKQMDPQLLVQGIRKVHGGGQWIERNSAKQAIEKMLQREIRARELAALLTAREIEIIRMVARGMSNKGLAENLFISLGTVKTHLHNIYKKLNLDGRWELLRYAREKDLL